MPVQDRGVVVAAFVLVVLALVAVLVGFQTLWPARAAQGFVGASTPAPQPVFGYVKMNTITRVVDPGTVIVTGAMPGQALGLVRFGISAKSPVTFAVIREEDGPRLLADAATVRRESIFYCMHERVLGMSDLHCSIPDMYNHRYSLVIFDDRDVSTTASLGAGALVAMGVKGPLQDMLVRNDVELTISGLQCVKNCPTQ